MAQIFASERTAPVKRPASVKRNDTVYRAPELALARMQSQADQSSSTAQLMQLQALQQTGVANGIAENAPVQRVEEEEALQGKAVGEALQRMGGEEEELMQGKAKSETLQLQPGSEQGLMKGVETLSGADMSDVRVHYNSSAPARVQAQAYAQGSNIHLASGQEKHLPHEAWHVAQQKQGRVKPTTDIGGVAVNDDPSLEKEADSMGAKASQLAAKAPTR